MTYRCDECGKALASEGGYEIHMAGHAVEAAAPPVRIFDFPDERGRRARGPKAEPAEMLVAGAAVAILAVFLVGMAVILRPSLIKQHKNTAALAAAAQPAPATPGPVPATTPTTSQAAADEQLANTLVLREADFGPGWAFPPADNSSSATGDAAVKELLACVGSGNFGSDNTADVSGPDATLGSLQVSTEASMVPTEQDTVKDLSVVRAANFAGCLKRSFTAGFKADGTPATDISVQRFTPNTGRVTSTGYTIIVTVTGPNGPVSVFIDMVFLARGRMEPQITLTSVGARAPANIEQALLLRLADKAAGV